MTGEQHGYSKCGHEEDFSVDWVDEVLTNIDGEVVQVYVQSAEDYTSYHMKWLDGSILCIRSERVDRYSTNAAGAYMVDLHHKIRDGLITDRDDIGRLHYRVGEPDE